MKIYIIRHGETNANVEGKLQGWIDIPLNENGIMLAEITGNNMSDISFDAAFSSPLVRAKDTAEILLKSSGNHGINVITDERIKEMHFGSWEGKKFKNGEYEIPEDKAKLIFADPFALGTCPEGESFQDLCLRTQEFLKELASKKEYKDSNILVATHGCALRAMLNFLYDDPANFWHGHVPYNCAVNVVEVSDGNIRLIEDDKLYYDKSYCVDRYSSK